MMAEFGWKMPFYADRKAAKARPKPDARLAELIRGHNRFDLALYDFDGKLFEVRLLLNEIR